MLDMVIVVCNDSLGCEKYKTPEGDEDYENTVCDSE